MYAGDGSQNHLRKLSEENSQNESRGDIRCPRPRNNHRQADQIEFDEGNSQQSLQIKNSFKQSVQENSHAGKPPIRLSLRHSSRAPSIQTNHQTSIEQTEQETNEKNIQYQQNPIKLSQFEDSSRGETDFDVEQPKNYPPRAFSEKCLSEPYQTDLKVQNSVFTQSSTHLIENNGYQTENEINDSKHVTLAYGGGTENQTQNKNPVDQNQEALQRKSSVGHISFTSGQRQFSNWMTGKHQQYLKDLQLNSNFGQSLQQKLRPQQESSRIEIEETMSSRPVAYSQPQYIKPMNQENEVRSLSSDILNNSQMQRSKITFIPQDISMEETETRSYAGLSDHRIQKQPSQPIQNEKNYRNILNDLSTRTYERDQNQFKYQNKTQINMHRSFDRNENYNNKPLMNKQIVPIISNRISDPQQDSGEHPQDRKAIIRQMVLKNSRNNVTLSSQDTNDQAVRLSQLFKKKEQICTKRQAQSTSVEIPSRKPFASSFADQISDNQGQNLHQTSGKVNIGVLRKLQQMQLERKSYEQVQFDDQKNQKLQEIYMLPVVSLSQSYDNTNRNMHGDQKRPIDDYTAFSPVNTSTQQSFASSVTKNRITRFKQIERDLEKEREEQIRQEQIKLQNEEVYREERAQLLRKHYQQLSQENQQPNYYQESQNPQNEYQSENQKYGEQRKEIQPYSRQDYLQKNVQHVKIHSFANSPGFQKSNFPVGIVAPGDNLILNQQRQDYEQIYQNQFQSAESFKDSNFTLGGETEKNNIAYQDWNDTRQPLIKRMGTAMFGEQKLSQEQLNQAISREVKNRYSIASFEKEFQEDEDSLMNLQKSNSQFQILRKPWNSRERNNQSQNNQNDKSINQGPQEEFVQNYQLVDQSWENQSKKELQQSKEHIQYNKEIQLKREFSGRQYPLDLNQKKELSEIQYQQQVPLIRESFEKQQHKDLNKRSDLLAIQNNFALSKDSFEKFSIKKIQASKEPKQYSQDIKVQDRQYLQQVQSRENNFQKKNLIEEPIENFYGQFIDQDRQTIQHEKQAFIQRYEKLMQKQALIKEQAAKFSTWKSDGGLGIENSFDYKQSSVPQSNHKYDLVQSIEASNYQSNLKNQRPNSSTSTSPVTLARMQLKSSFGQQRVNQARNEHQPETSKERLKRLLPPQEFKQLESENLNIKDQIQSFSPEVSFAPQQIHSYLARVHYKLPDIEAKARISEVRQEINKAVTNLNSTFESQGLLLHNQKSSKGDFQPALIRNNQQQYQNKYDENLIDREKKAVNQIQSFKSLPEQIKYTFSQDDNEMHRITSIGDNQILKSTISSFPNPKAQSAVETIIYNDQTSKLSNYKQQQNQSENDDRSTQMQIKTVSSSQKYIQEEQLFSESSKMAKMRQTVMESQKVAPDVKELIHMQFLQAQMLMDLHKQFMQASAIEEGSIEYQTEQADFTERSQNQVQDHESCKKSKSHESYENIKTSSQNQLESIRSICKSMRDAEVQADYDFTVQSKSTVSNYFEQQNDQQFQEIESQFEQKTQSIQGLRNISNNGSQSKEKLNTGLRHSLQSYGSQHQSGQKSSQLLLNQIEVTVPQDQCPSQLKSQYIPKSIHDINSGNISQQDLESRRISQSSLQFLENSRSATLQQPIQINESHQRSSKTFLKSVCEASVAGLSQISQTKGKTLTLISKIYKMIEKIDKHVAAKEVLDEVRFMDMQKRMFKLSRKYKALKEENQILLKSHRGEPESYDSSIRGRQVKKHNFSQNDEESEFIKINEKNKGTLTERILSNIQ